MKALPADSRWQFDLRSAGYTGFTPRQEQWGLHLRPNPLSFLDNDILAATFITRESVQTLSRRDEGEQLPLRLHAVFLKFDSGELKATKQWSITRPRGGIIRAGEGRFAILTPSGIAVYLLNRQVVTELSLTAKEQSDLWDFKPSPSGKTIMAEFHAPKAYYQRIETASLIPQPASVPTVAFAISDTAVAIMRNSAANPGEVLIQILDGSWHTICSAANSVEPCDDPQFISNELLAIQSSHSFNIVAASDGSPLFKARFGKDDWLSHSLYPSADGKRLAVAVWAHKGGSTFFDISSRNVLKRIVVYDIPSRQQVYVFDAKRHKTRDLSGLALSHDGRMLALLSDGFVRTYDLDGLAVRGDIKN